MGDDTVGRDLAPVNLFDAPNLLGAETVQIAEYFLNDSLSFELFRADFSFHFVEKGRPGIRPEGGYEFPGVYGAALRAGHLIVTIAHL